MLKKAGYLIPLLASFALLFFSAPAHAATVTGPLNQRGAYIESDGHTAVFTDPLGYANASTTNPTGFIVGYGSVSATDGGSASWGSTINATQDIVGNQNIDSGTFSYDLNNSASGDGNYIYVGWASSGVGDGSCAPALGGSTGCSSFVLFTDTGGVWTVSPNTGPPGTAWDGISTTHAYDITSPQRYGTTTSPVTFDFSAYVGTDATSSDGYVIVVNDEATGQAQSFYGLLPSYTVGTPFTVSTTTIALETSSAYTGTVYIVSGMANYIAYGTQPVYAPTGAGANATIPFAVGTSYASRNNPLPLPPAYTGNSFSSTTCSVNFLGSFDLGDCIGYLVSPSASEMANFSSINLQNKFPFVYLYQMGTIRNALFTATGTATTSIGVSIPVNGKTWNLTFISESMIASVPYTPWLRTILDALLWFMLAELIYYQVIRSHDKVTPTT